LILKTIGEATTTSPLIMQVGSPFAFYTPQVHLKTAEVNATEFAAAGTERPDKYKYGSLIGFACDIASAMTKKEGGRRRYLGGRHGKDVWVFDLLGKVEVWFLSQPYYQSTKTELEKVLHRQPPYNNNSQSDPLTTTDDH
jgi:hypothetical protein